MKIQSLALKNFRCFRDLTIELDEQLTVIVAANGCGKSTVLDALAGILSAFVAQFDKKQRQRNADEDIRVIKKEDGSRAVVSPSTMEADIHVGGRVERWGRTLLGALPQQPDDTPAVEYAKKLLGRLRSEEPNGATPLPLIGYYGSSRTASPEELKAGLDLGSAALMREEGYQGCLTGNANVNLFRTWYGNAAIAELAVQQKLSRNEPVAPSERKLAERARAVKETVNRVLNGASGEGRYWLDLFFSMQQVGVLDSVQGVELGLNQLSDGVQCMLSLAGDLAARCAVLNPQFGADAPRKTTGVVMIDEVDLHLHPAWQQRVLRDLQTAFPGLQFVVTTHSPQVLTTVRKEQIRLLSEYGVVEELPADLGTFGAESSRVLAEIFATHTRPPNAPTVHELREYLTLVELEQQDEDRGRKLRADLEDSLGSSDPDLLAADARISQLATLRGR